MTAINADLKGRTGRGACRGAEAEGRGCQDGDKPFQIFCLQCFCFFKKLYLSDQVAILAMETEEENLSEEKKLSLGQEVPVSQVFQINFVAKINTGMAHFRDAINICVGSPATYFVFWDQLILLKRNMFDFHK